MTTYDVTLAVLAGWLPRFEPPLGDNSFDKPYSDRLKLNLTVDEQETLAHVYQRAIDHWQPRIAADSEAHPENPLDVIYWISFYIPGDESAFQHRYERAQQLILVDEKGHACWNKTIDEIPYGHLVRASQHELLLGDPFRPYLPLLLPQGGGAFQVAWETLLIAWKVLQDILTVQGARTLASDAQARLSMKLARHRVIDEQRAQWVEHGGDPISVRRTLDRKPWSPDELRMLLGVPSVSDAEDLLALFGFEPTPSGEYVIGSTEENRLLRLVEDDVFETFTIGASDAQLRPRLEHLLATGERPPGSVPPS